MLLPCHSHCWSVTFGGLPHETEKPPCAFISKQWKFSPSTSIWVKRAKTSPIFICISYSSLRVVQPTLFQTNQPLWNSQAAFLIATDGGWIVWANWANVGLFLKECIFKTDLYIKLYYIVIMAVFLPCLFSLGFLLTSVPVCKAAHCTLWKGNARAAPIHKKPRQTVLMTLERDVSAPPAVCEERPHLSQRNRQRFRLPVTVAGSDSLCSLNIPTPPQTYRSLYIRHSLWKVTNINISRHCHFWGFILLINKLFCP